MSYIGSSPLTQYFKSGTDIFPVSTLPTNVFTLTRPVNSINDIQVFMGNNTYASLLTNYTVSGNTLTLGTAVTNTTVSVRYQATSNFSVTPSSQTIQLSALNAANNPTRNNILRGDGQWAGIGVPVNTQLADYILQATDNGGSVIFSGNTITLNQNIFGVGDAVTIYNANLGTPITISVGTGVNLIWANGGLVGGAVPAGNRRLAINGICTMLSFAFNQFLISGTGLS